MNALIFDCDGVLADTERDGHLPAFNATFEEFGLPLRWSEDEYAEKLRIGGGKERIAAAFTPEVIAKLGIHSESERAAYIAKLHAAKTKAFTEIVAAGRLPGRPGVARLARAMHERGWLLAVASTSAEASVRAVLASVVGAEFAAEFAIFAGDVVPHKKPAPDIYTLAIRELGVEARDALVVEDSRNGLVAATEAGLTCVVTLSSFTQNEDMHEATLVVSSLGEPDGPASEVVANRSRARVGTYVTPDDLVACVAAGAVHAPTAVAQIDFTVRSIAKTAIVNEKYFGELDAVVGDGDLGESLARGFEAILADLDGFDRSSAGAFLRKIGMSVTSKIGGTSGPLWGTGFLRAAAVAGDRATLTRDDVRAMLKAATDGIMQRGQSSVGDKTLLDVLVPVTLALDEHPNESQLQTYERLADVAEASAAQTMTMLAKRGRASYSGERSVGSVDAGAAAVALIIANLRDAHRAREEQYA